MRRKFYKELWKIRFEKMLALEKKSTKDYESLLDECRSHPKGPAIKKHLEHLIADEKKHAKLCEELLAILNRQAE